MLLLSQTFVALYVFFNTLIDTYLDPLGIEKKSVNQSEFCHRNIKDVFTRVRVLSMQYLDCYITQAKYIIYIRGYVLNERKGEGIQPD